MSGPYPASHRQQIGTVPTKVRFGLHDRRKNQITIRISREMYQITQSTHTVSSSIKFGSRPKGDLSPWHNSGTIHTRMGYSTSSKRQLTCSLRRSKWWTRPKGNPSRSKPLLRTHQDSIQRIQNKIKPNITTGSMFQSQHSRSSRCHTYHCQSPDKPRLYHKPRNHQRMATTHISNKN